MGRNEYRAAYREARKAAGFVIRFWGSLQRVRGDLSMFSTSRACPGFSASRLHGDVLNLPASVKVGNRSALCVRPRLPA